MRDTDVPRTCHRREMVSVVRRTGHAPEPEPERKQGVREDFRTFLCNCTVILTICRVYGVLRISSKVLIRFVSCAGRSEWIRTTGPCLPKTVLYQAELHSEPQRNALITPADSACKKRAAPAPRGFPAPSTPFRRRTRCPRRAPAGARFREIPRARRAPSRRSGGRVRAWHGARRSVPGGRWRA